MRMGTAMQSCCTIAITLEELKSRCNNALLDTETSYKPPSYISATHIGITGASDASNPDDWIVIPQVDYEYFVSTVPLGYVNQSIVAVLRKETALNYRDEEVPAAVHIGIPRIVNVPIWNEDLRICSGVYSGIDLRLRMSYVGPAVSPALQITGVEQTYRSSVWEWNEQTANADGTHDFPLCTAVSFTEANDLVDDSNAPLIERDVFYPLLVYLDSWGMRMGVLNFFIIIFLAAPLLVAMAAMEEPFSALHSVIERSHYIYAPFTQWCRPLFNCCRRICGRYGI